MLAACAAAPPRIASPVLAELRLGVVTEPEILERYGQPNVTDDSSPGRRRLFYFHVSDGEAAGDTGYLATFDFLGDRLEGYLFAPMAQNIAALSFEPLFALKPWSASKQTVQASMGPPRGRYTCALDQRCRGESDEYWIWFAQLDYMASDPQKAASDAMSSSAVAFFSGDIYVGCNTAGNQTARCHDSLTRRLDPAPGALLLGTTTLSAVTSLLGEPQETSTIIHDRRAKRLRYIFSEGAPPARPVAMQLAELVFVDDTLVAAIHLHAPKPTPPWEHLTELVVGTSATADARRLMGEPTARVLCPGEDGHCAAGARSELWLWLNELDFARLRGPLTVPQLLRWGMGAYFLDDRYRGCVRGAEPRAQTIDCPVADLQPPTIL